MRLVVPPDPLTVPTWLTAIFTGVLAAGAIVTAIFAIMAFRKQSAELTILNSQASDQRETNAKLAAAAELQAQELRESLEERKLERERRHRAQAEQVYVTLKRTPGTTGGTDADVIVGRIARPPEIAATVRNDSQQIIHHVQLRWHQGVASFGEPNPEPLPELIPQAEVTRDRKFPADCDLERSGAVVVFRDAAGTRWLRRPDGELQEQP